VVQYVAMCWVCCSVLQFVAVCCSALHEWRQCGSPCWCCESVCVLWCAAMCCSVLQCAAMCVAAWGASMWQPLLVLLRCARVTVCCSVLQCVAVCCIVLHCVYSVLQCSAACCSVVQRVAVGCIVCCCRSGKKRIAMFGAVITCKKSIWSGTYVHIYMDSCIDVYTYIYTYVFMYKIDDDVRPKPHLQKTNRHWYVCIYVYGCIYRCVYVYVYVYMYITSNIQHSVICTYIYIRMYIYINVHTHTHIHMYLTFVYVCIYNIYIYI